MRHDTTLDEGAVDLEALQRDLVEGGVDHIFYELVEIFVTNAPSWLDDIVAAFHDGRLSHVREAVHAYKSRALSIRAHHLALILHAMERGAIRGDERCIDLMPELVRSHRAACTQLAGILLGASTELWRKA